MTNDAYRNGHMSRPPTKGKILVVSNYYPPFMVGGAEVVAHRQVMMLRQRGWSVAVFAGRAANNLGDVGNLDVEDQDGVPVYRLSHAWMDMGKNFRNAFASKVFTSLLHTYKPDWVHFHNLIGLGTDLIPVAKRFRVRTALTLHDYWGICYRGILLRRDWSVCDNAEMCGYCCEANVKTDDGEVPIRLRRDYVAWCLEQVDTILSPSKSLADNYKTLGFAKPITPLTNGIDLRTVPARVRKPEKMVRFVCASYLGEHKGIPELISAIRILSKKPELDGRWEFTLAGGGHIEHQVLALASELPDAFHFIGKVPRPEMLRRLHEADVVVLASIWPENEPVSLLEALASGAGIVATRLGGNVEIVADDRSGILCEPRDAEVLAESLAQFIRAPERINQISQYNIQRAKDYDEERTADYLEELYKNKIAPETAREKIVICGGGLPDAGSRQLIDALSFSQQKSKVRLLWQDWIGDKAWEIADGFWWWGDRLGLGQLTTALSRGIPVCVRDGESAEQIARHLPVNVYHNEASFMSWIDALPHLASSERHFVDIALLRQNNRLRPRADFHLPC